MRLLMKDTSWIIDCSYRAVEMFKSGALRASDFGVPNDDVSFVTYWHSLPYRWDALDPELKPVSLIEPYIEEPAKTYRINPAYLSARYEVLSIYHKRPEDGAREYWMAGLDTIKHEPVPWS